MSPQNRRKTPWGLYFFLTFVIFGVACFAVYAAQSSK